ncbi:hypothetical protein NPIL_184311 [Nephila pilipes]|uniref:Uncharacterized protein n=1 Tax=Nephila pilipes TaxID=299642 RepID=A0A8X6UAC5_NEPPI|nr:hypothetical protein NPIL_184311 [Nephila pilipes]
MGSCAFHNGSNVNCSILNATRPVHRDRLCSFRGNTRFKTSKSATAWKSVCLYDTLVGVNASDFGFRVSVATANQLTSPYPPIEDVWLTMTLGFNSCFDIVSSVARSH